MTQIVAQAEAGGEQAAQRQRRQDNQQQLHAPVGPYQTKHLGGRTR
jgi:hypothetical protein